jgi:hypothetical protein
MGWQQRYQQHGGDVHQACRQRILQILSINGKCTCSKLSKAASLMKKCIWNRVGKDKVWEVGEIVHFPLKDVDKAKVDTGNLTRVIVQVDKNHSQARVAVKS